MKQKMSWKIPGTIFRHAVPALCTLGLATLAVTSTTVLSQDGLKASIDPDAPELAIAVVRDTGEEVPYDVINGMAILENDIILGTHAEVQAYGIEPLSIMPTTSGDCGEEEYCSLVTTSSNRIWPGGVVPFTIQAGTSDASRQTIDRSIADWETKTSIRFIERTNEVDYIEFVSVGGDICSSRLGRSGGMQTVNFAGSSCLVHEIGHAMGLSHEQNRNDRDNFIIVDFSNIAGNFASQYRVSTTSTDVGPYDFRSVMHYTAFQFGIDSSIPTIRPRDPNIPLSDVGGVSLLSPGDVLGIEFVYGGSTLQPPPPPPPPPVGVVPSVAFGSGLTNGGTIPALTAYGDITVLASDPDAGTSDGVGIESVTLTISRDGVNLGSRRELRTPYQYGFRLESGRSYTLTATAQSTVEAGGTSSSTSITVTAQ